MKRSGLVDTSQMHEDPASPGEDKAAHSPLAVWLNDRQISFIVLLALTAASFYLMYLIFQPFLAAIFLSLVLSIAFLPLHDRISRLVRIDSAAAGITTAAIVLFVLVPSILLSVKVLAEATNLFRSFSQQWSSSGDFERHVNSFYRLAGHAGISQERLRAEIATRIQEFGSWSVRMVGSAARGVAEQSMTAVLIFFMLFFLLRDRQKFRRALSDLLPLPPGRLEELSAIVHTSIVHNIYGMFTVGVTQGILTALGFWVTGLRAPLLWGVVSMILSFVPLVGPILVWLPGAVVLALAGGWGKAILLFVWGAVLVSGADYIIRPRFAGVGKDANTLLVLLSFFGGVKAFGIIGFFFGPVMLSLIIGLLRIVREERQGRSLVVVGSDSRRVA